MKVQNNLTKKTKEVCENLALECLNEVDFKPDTLGIINRYVHLLNKNLGVYKMTAFSELVHVFHRVLEMAEEGDEFNLDIVGNYTKWEDDIPNENIKKWKDADYATIYVTVHHYNENNKKAFDETLNTVIEVFRSCIDPEDYEVGDVECWRREVVIDDAGNEIKEKVIVNDEQEGEPIEANEEKDEFKVYETTFSYSFYSHEWANQD